MVYEAFFPKLVILGKKKKSDTVKGSIRISRLVPNSFKTNGFSRYVQSAGMWVVHRG